MSSPFHGNRAEINSSKSKLGLGMSNGSIDSTSRSSSQLINNQRDIVRKKMKRSKKSVFMWTPSEVRQWLQKNHRKYHVLYADLFQEHDISGRALVRLDEIKLQRMGITNKEHRLDLREKILKLRIKHEKTELELLCDTDKEIG